MTMAEISHSGHPVLQVPGSEFSMSLLHPSMASHRSSWLIQFLPLHNEEPLFGTLFGAWHKTTIISQMLRVRNVNQAQQR